MKPFSDRLETAGAALLGCVTAIGTLEPIRNYDYFWHLAAGRWIVEHRALPASDPFTLASHDHAWINLEWLFQIALYPLHAGLGLEALTVLLALLAGGGAFLLARLARFRAPFGSAIFLAAVAWMGAAHRLDLRPETAAIPIFVLFLALILRPVGRWQRGLAIAAIVVPWMAVHPSALLAPVMSAVVLTGAMVERRGRSEIAARLSMTAGAGLALLVNPWGLEGVLAPVRLASLLRREELVNLEWLPSTPAVFPELYAIATAGFVLLAWRKHGELRVARLLLFLMLAVLAIQFVRNHAFFYPALPVLLAPSIGSLGRFPDRILLLLACGAVAIGLARQRPGIGIDESRFPVGTTALIQQGGLEGHIYNPDQFGGYLIWHLHPDRRVLVDGRNELYLDFFRNFERARVDSREWRALFADHRLDLAVDEYRRDPVELIDGTTGEKALTPGSLVYFPRNEWALIGFDEASMLFARRDALAAAVIDEMELSSVVPDAASPDTAIGDPRRALQELERLESKIGSFDRLEKLKGWALREIEKG